jgi:eukaryotic-like serine/threonine-protein kinase
MKRFLRGFGIFLALLGIGIVSALAVVSYLLRQEEVRVPDLTGQDIVTVIDTLNLQGLQLKVERRVPDQLLPRNTVISQTPPAGSGIKKGRPVRVVVSEGPSDLLTPRLIGEYYRKADILIRLAGFLPGSVAKVSSDTVERDMVIAQMPQPGTPLEKNDTISLLVSSGKKQATLTTPQLVGKRAEEAVRILERMGLQHRLSYRAADEKGPATTGRMVLNQRPAAGYAIAADGMVEIVATR